jgi:L-fuconolactonase
MPVVDAHHHLMDPARIEYGFLPFLPQLERFIGHEELGPLCSDAGVDATVCVQASECEDETAFMLEQAAEARFVAGVVGWLPLADPVATGRAIDRYSSQDAPLKGVRHLLQDEPDDDWVVQDTVIESLRLLANAGWTFDISAFNLRHLEHVPTIAERVPELDLVLCHFGMPGTTADDWAPWLRAFDSAARAPRCHVKVSGLDMYRGGCDVEAFRPYFDAALEHFGSERMIWASNWPVSLQGEGYTELLDTARALLVARSDAERDAIFGGNAIRVYKLNLPS